MRAGGIGTVERSRSLGLFAVGVSEVCVGVSYLTTQAGTRSRHARRHFGAVYKEVSRCSLSFKDLSNSADGTFNLKLEMRASEGNWFGRRLAFAFLHIKEYRANVPPANSRNLFTYLVIMPLDSRNLKRLDIKGINPGAGPDQPLLTIILFLRLIAVSYSTVLGIVLLLKNPSRFGRIHLHQTTIRPIRTLRH
ncbi:hypothetical protein IEQ34_001437 [Dendrobium chrysotoxum]|uniref:Uncharacterized protein n=1 Tax=Dendrobium chrysotoxum TaxID=161865 RepID=A0AAV7HQ19_DENCH|nr:hypothetical protein IEQ34_001437 [Dendrobium chrysotoxum]